MLRNKNLTYFDGLIIGFLAFAAGALVMKNKNKIKRLFKYTNNDKRETISSQIDEVLDAVNRNGGFTAELRTRYDKLVNELNLFDKNNKK